MQDERKTYDRELTAEEQHRKAWLEHALQTPPPYPHPKSEKLLDRIISVLKINK